MSNLLPVLPNRLDDASLEVVFWQLAADLKSALAKNNLIWFPPDKIAISGSAEFLAKQRITATPAGDASIKTPAEAVRLLGVVVYHLATGQSELNNLSYLLDGYQQAFDSKFWPWLQKIANGQLSDLAGIKKQFTELKESPLPKPSVKPEPEKVKEKPTPLDPQIAAKFTQLKSFPFPVPTNYEHDHQLSNFRAKHEKDFYSFNSAITDANFAKATNQLAAGKTYQVKIFGINEYVTSEECLALLKSQQAILVGAQGLPIIWKLKKEEFPVSKWLVSFDEKEALWRDGGGVHRVPDIGRDSGGGWHFGLGSFEGDWGGDYCLMCVCDC